MVNEEVLSFIASVVDSKSNETVLEIGPGLGFLTRLWNRPAGSPLIGVEKDPLLADYLKRKFMDSRIKIIQQDILDLNLRKDLKLSAPIHVFGNIPYNITSPILEWLMGQRKYVSKAVLTMQWEVAQRLTAEPGTKIWGALSVFVQFHADVEIMKKISKTCFYPTPKVDSAIVKLSFPNTPKHSVQSEENFFKLVRKAFQKRRKTILNSLADANSPGLSKAVLESLLKKADIDPMRRPETLSIPEWVRLSEIVLA